MYVRACVCVIFFLFLGLLLHFYVPTYDVYGLGSLEMTDKVVARGVDKGEGVGVGEKKQRQ
jgi:hypothetical protein